MLRICSIYWAPSMGLLSVTNLLLLSSKFTLFACAVKWVWSLCLLPFARWPVSVGGSRVTSQEETCFLSLGCSQGGLQPWAADWRYLPCSRGLVSSPSCGSLVTWAHCSFCLECSGPVFAPPLLILPVLIEVSLRSSSRLLLSSAPAATQSTSWVLFLHNMYQISN